MTEAREGEVVLPQSEVTESPFSDGARLTAFIKKDRQLVDYSQMVSPQTRVIALGETHTREITKREVMDHLEQFRDLGFTHFAMEVFGTDVQATLNEYQVNGTRKEKLLQYLKEHWGEYSAEAADLYLQAVGEAKRVGLQVVGIDLPHSEKDQYPLESREGSTKRDEIMAQTVRAILDENPEYKVVTFTGSFHAGKSEDTMADILTTNGIETVTVDILGGKPEGESLFEESAEKAGVAGERFMVPSLAKFPDSKTPYDWMVHLPQVEAETPIERLSRELGESLEELRRREELFRPRVFLGAEPPSYRGEKIKTYTDLSPQPFLEHRFDGETSTEVYTGIEMHKGGQRYLFTLETGFRIMTPTYEGSFSDIDVRTMAPEEAQILIQETEQQLEKEPQAELSSFLQEAKNRFTEEYLTSETPQEG